MSRYRSNSSWWDAVEEYWFQTFLVLIVLGVFGAILYEWLQPPEPFIKAPRSSCKESRTGRSKEEVIVQMACAGYDAKGICTVQMPVTTTYTVTEVRVQCDFTEWRTE